MRRRSTRAIAMLAALAALVGGPAIANADIGGGGGAPIWGTITITIGPTATLTAKLLAQVPVDVTCSLTDLGRAAGASTTPDFSFVEVSVSEAVSKTSIAQGAGSTGPFVCDGSTTHFTIPVQSFNVPFKGGKALVQASAEADWLPFDPNTGQLAGTAFAATNSLLIHLK